ncbi:MAG: hypothetical protein HY322_02360 [Betaproteobacteria bacterium]|nr:hypothetical protein [Betaproteobacteria bacterium]
MKRLIFMLALAWAWPAFGQAYPAKPVRIIVAQAPGGASDLLIRVLGRKLGEILGEQIIIDNRPGAGGNIGAEVAAQAAPDEIVRKLNGAIRQSLALPEVRKFYEKRGADQMSGAPEEMRAFLQSETAKWAAVVKASGARID